MGLHTFKKSERLSSKTSIKELFNRGSSFYLYPFKVIYLPNPNQELSSTQVLISVPKKNFKKAVDRNLIKRRVREAYRLNKHILQQPEHHTAHMIGFIYTAKDSLDYQKINEKLMDALVRLNKECFS